MVGRDLVPANKAERTARRTTHGPRDIARAASPPPLYRRVAAAPAGLEAHAAALIIAWPFCCADAVAGAATDAWDKVSGWSEDAWNKVGAVPAPC